MNEVGNANSFVSSGRGGLSSPKDLTLGPDGNLYVASAGTNSVLRFNSAGQSMGTFVAANSGGLANPFGLAFGPDGNLYVVGAAPSNAVYRYNGTTGAYLNTCVPSGTGGLNTPVGIAFGQDGNLYVSSKPDSSVLRYQGPLGSVPGNPLPSAGQSGATFVGAGSGGLNNPFELVFGPDGNLYVASTTANPAVMKFDGATGGFLSTYVASGTGGLSTPRGLAFDQDGRLYVADVGTSAIHRYDNQGQYLDDPVAATASTLRGPIGMTFNSQGALLVSSRDTNTVVRYDSGVVVTLSAASPTPVSVNYQTSGGTATEGADYSAQAGTITFAAGETSRRILLATHDDLLVEGNEVFNVQLSNATGGATIATGNATVTIVDDDITRQFSISDASATEGDHTVHYRGPFVQAAATASLSLPAFGPDGNLYVNVLGGPSAGGIDRYDGTTGAFIDHFVAVGRLNGGRDMAFSGGYLYVGEEYNDDVLRFNAATGAFDRVFVTAGSGGLDGPHGLAFGPDANGDGLPELYVSGRNSFNVVRYDGATGQPLGTYVTSGSGGMSWPEGITFDPTGTYLDVASTGSNKILKYNALTGAYVGVGASTGLAAPKGVKFGPDGLLYVASADNNRILRFNASGTYIDDYVPAGSGGMTYLSRLVFGPDGDVYVSVGGTGADPSKIYRFGTESEALFTVSVSTASALPLTVNYSTADGTALAGGDYTATSGTVTFAPGITSKTLRVPTVNDAIAEPTETFTLNLSNATGGSITRGQGVATIYDDDSTKFYVVNDASGVDQTYKYGRIGSSLGNSTLNSGDTAPRGASTTAAGTTVWVVDANKHVYVYNNSGGLLGSWTAGSLSSHARVEGIATNGTDVWIVDAYQDKVYRYANAAGRLSGSQNATSSFYLNGSDANPKDIVTDGTSLWTVDDGAVDQVFKYTLSGSLLGSWTLNAGTSPTGITLDPTNVGNLWVVDNATNRVYQYDNAASLTSGSQWPSTSFALAAGNTNPQGIADPPFAAALPAVAPGRRVAITTGSRHPDPIVIAEPQSPSVRELPTARPMLFRHAAKSVQETHRGLALTHPKTDQGTTLLADRMTPSGPLSLRSHFTARRRHA